MVDEQLPNVKSNSLDPTLVEPSKPRRFELPQPRWRAHMSGCRVLCQLRAPEGIMIGVCLALPMWLAIGGTLHYLIRFGLSLPR
jgi:hypothetical protein